MNGLPIFLTLQGRRVLVAGGGERAASKVLLLRAAGADVTVVAPRLGREIAALAEEGAVRHVARAFVDGDVRGSAVAYGATGIGAVDERVSAAACAAGVPVNVVDRPDLSTFVMPAIVDRHPVVIGISTGGAAPVLARKLRTRIEALLPARLGALASFAESFRGAVKATVADAGARRRFWERFFDGPLAEHVLNGDERAAREGMLALVNKGAAAEPEGVVHIVGAGPGDPDLLTLRAARLLGEADVVIYDELVGPNILDCARRDAVRIYAGKKSGFHASSQDEINDLMTRHARAGRRVVRLKGGDPFVFGRGGEELDHLRAAGIEAEVVPGITAATGCAAAAHIPLTHRDFASAVTFVTGRAREGGEPDLDWAALVRLRQTLVIYMGLATAGTIAGRLIEHGLAPSTPVAVIEKGTLAEQRVVVGTVAELGTLVAENGIDSPALIVIGEVARFAASDEGLLERALAV